MTRSSTGRPPRHKAQRQTIPLDMLRPALAELIRAEQPDLRDDELIPLATVHRYRARHIETLLAADDGSLSALDAEVARAIAAEETIADDIEADYDRQRTFGDKAADLIASFGGSWTFLILFAAFLAAWMLISRAQGSASFDPFPFILLNLILSTIAAVQAPIIMMSQRRQEEKDRMRARNDYMVNLKAELEIRHLHEKVEHLHERTQHRIAELSALIASDRLTAGR